MAFFFTVMSHEFCTKALSTVCAFYYLWLCFPQSPLWGVGIIMLCRNKLYISTSRQNMPCFPSILSLAATIMISIIGSSVLSWYSFFVGTMMISIISSLGTHTVLFTLLIRTHILVFTIYSIWFIIIIINHWFFKTGFLSL